MIAQETIEEVKSRANLVELLGESRSLKRVGSRYVTLCPFHNESTPSFNVNEESNTYYCFGCGVSGNAISFIMHTRGLSFPDAVEELAGRFGVEVKREGKIPADKNLLNKPKVFQVNHASLTFFERELQAAPAKVRSYLQSRGLSAETVAEFHVGFSPLDRGSLTKFLIGKGAPEDLLVLSGVSRRNSRGDLYDVFSGRLIFPIFLDAKRIAGFGGRVIPDLDPERLGPKYLNSAESPVYAKNRILYGFPNALPEIRSTGEAYLVEGYMDVIGLYQAGVKNAVATCGTALGEGHIKKLSQVAKRVAVLFDGDSAGRAAAAKSFKIFLNSPIDVWAVFLSEEEDPDTFAKKNGSKTRSLLESLPRVALIDVYVDSLVEKFGGASNIGSSSKAAIARDLSSLLSQVKDPVALADLTKRAASRLRVELDAFQSLVTGGVQAQPPQKVGALPEEAPEGQEAPPVSKLPRLDQELLHAVMALKDEVPRKILAESDLCTGIHPSTLRFVQGLAAISGDDENARRDEIRALLRHFGPSWVLHWKKTYQMVKDPQVSMEGVFSECRSAIKRERLRKLLQEIDIQLGLSLPPEERSTLLHERISLTRQLKAHGL